MQSRNTRTRHDPSPIVATAITDAGGPKREEGSRNSVTLRYPKVYCNLVKRKFNEQSGSDLVCLDLMNRLHRDTHVCGRDKLGGEGVAPNKSRPNMSHTYTSNLTHRPASTCAITRSSAREA
jgi:hypothetical protein